MKLFLILIFFTNSIFAFTIFEDINSDIKPSEIINYTDKFQKTKKQKINNYKSVIWLKFNLGNNTSKQQYKYILFHSSQFSSIDMFYYEENRLVESKNGLIIPIQKREVKLSNFVFKISIDKNKTKDIFIRIKSNNKTFSNTIYNNYNELHTIIQNQKSIFLFLSGIVFIIFLVVIFLYFYTKDILFIKYIFYLVSGYILLLFLNTYMQYIFYNQYYVIFNMMIADILFIAILLFFNEVLKLKNKQRFVYNYFNFMAFVFFILLVVKPLDIETIHTIRNRLIIPATVLSILLILIYGTIVKINMSKFLLIGWIFYIVGVLSILLKINAIYTSPYSVSIFQITTVIDMLIFGSVLLYIIKSNFDDKYKKELLLEKQSKFVTIGETLSNIEHQWRTPLSKISSNIATLENQIEFQGMPTKKNLQLSLLNIDNTITYMTQLINDFKNFYKEDENIKFFHINFALSSAIQLLDYEFKQYNIQLKQNIKDDYTILGNLNELTQVFLNIIGNSKDILVQRKIKNPYIFISINKVKDKIVITINDNGEGIKEENIDIIFDQFYSLKDNKSTGMGLYISKQIIEKRMAGRLEIENIDDGVCFTIIIK